MAQKIGIMQTNIVSPRLADVGSNIGERRLDADAKTAPPTVR